MTRPRIERARRHAAQGTWLTIRIEVRSSPAWRALPDDGRRLLDRIELELMKYRGAYNGQLKLTDADFIEWGIRDGSVARAKRYAIALGFLEQTFLGFSRGMLKLPSQYRLTYVSSRDAAKKGQGSAAVVPPTDEWERIKTLDEALALLAKVPGVPRSMVASRHSTTEKSSFPGGAFCPKEAWQNRLTMPTGKTAALEEPALGAKVPDLL
jgi:hypothetical protein